MDFSEAFKFNGPAPCYSPDGRYIASSSEQRVTIREIDQLQVVRVLSCLDKVQKLAWCCNSNYLLCRLPDRAQVWSVHDHDWSYKIDEGAAGVRHCQWSPDGSCVLAIADFQIRLSVHSMRDGNIKILRGPKAVDQGFSFSPSKEWLAYAERSDCKEFVSLVSCADWKPRLRIPVGTQDLADLAWSPDSSCLVVWDTVLTYKLLVYNLEGQILASYSAYQDALGIRTVQFSPDGNMLAVGSYDQVVRILSGRSWRPVVGLEHRPLLKEEGRMVAYQEVDESAKIQRNPSRSRSRYIVGEFPFRIPLLKPAPDKPNPKLGIGSMSWSPDGEFLASHNENMPQTLFIWSSKSLELVSVIVQGSPIRVFRWAPLGQRLIICTGSTKLYLWSPKGASCVHIPVTAFSAFAVEWTRSGNALMLADKDTFCCAYIGFTGEDVRPA